MPRAFLQFEPVVNTPWGNWRAKFFADPTSGQSVRLRLTTDP